MTIQEGSLYGVVANMLNCDIVVSEFNIQLHSLLGYNTLVKGMNSLITQLWFKSYHYCSSTRIALTLNNQKRNQAKPFKLKKQLYKKYK